ncbi:GHMP kinase [Haematococcus lacustris]
MLAGQRGCQASPVENRVKHRNSWKPHRPSARRLHLCACADQRRAPVKEQCSAFAPATIANLGPGFDWLGCAVQGGGDTVTARALPDQPGVVLIDKIEGDKGRLSLDPAKNCIGIAAQETLKLLGPVTCGVGLTLHKGLPLGSGLGSSAASAAAAAWAVNGLFGSPLVKAGLIGATVASEAAVSGYHADNVGPSLLGGFVLIRSCTPGVPIELLPLALAPAASELYFVLVNPVFEAPTAEMRAVLPKQVSMSAMINNCCQGGSLVAGVLTGDVRLIGRALDSDVIIEPVRGPLIPGLLAVKAAAKAAGAYGATISGAGPTAVAVVDSQETGQKVLQAMCKAFREAGQLEVNSAQVVKLDMEGARFV